MSALDDLVARLNNAAKNPPALTQEKVTVQMPDTLHTGTDSRGRRRMRATGQGKARQSQIERAGREMVSGAKTELIIKAKGQLKP